MISDFTPTYFGRTHTILCSLSHFFLCHCHNKSTAEESLMHMLQAEADQLNNSLCSGKHGVRDRLGGSTVRKAGDINK